MALSHRYVAIYPSGATDPISDTPNGTDGSPSSYDDTYTSISSMEASENGDFTTGDGTVLHVEIIESDGSWSSAPDTSALSLDGWATDKSGDGSCIKIESFGGAKSSDGLWDTTAYILEVSGSDRCIFVDNDSNSLNYLDIEFKYVQFTKPALSTNQVLMIPNGAYHNDIDFVGCYFLHDGTTGACLLLDDNNNAVIRIKNCIAESASAGMEIVFLADSDQTVYVYNCTFFGSSADCVETNNHGNLYIVNCAVFNNTDDWQDAFIAGYPNYCASDDNNVGSNKVDISPGATELDDWHDAFTDPDGSPPDVTIKDTDSVLYQAGQNQTADSEVPSTDIIGTTRPSGASAVSIGAFEFVSGGSYTVTVPGITGNTYIETFSLQQQHNLSLSDVTATTHISEITLSVSAAATLVVSDITSNTYIETFGIEQQHNLSLTDITSNTYIEAFSLDQVHNLSLSDITTTTHISEITLSVIVPGVDTLVVSDITGLTYISDTGLSQQHSLTVSDILQQNYIESVGLGVNHVLSVSDITVSTHIESPTLTYGYRIAPAGITVETSIDTLSLIQAYYLSIYGIAQGNYIESPTLSYSGTVSLGQVIDPYLKTTTVNRKLTTTTTAREIKTA